MQVTKDCTRTPVANTLANAFSPAFLARLRRSRCRGEVSSTERQAVLSGPWQVEPIDSGPCRGNGARYAVVRRDEPAAEGGGVFGVFRDRSPALLTAAVLPTAGTPPAFHLNRHEGRPGYALHCGREFIGHLARAEEGLLASLDVARALIGDPTALAQLVEAAGPETLAILGRALARQMEG